MNRFQKRASYRLVYLYEKLSIFIKSPDFNEIIDFNEIKEIKEITDNQFSKRELIPFSVLLHENFQCFGPNHDI